jgi:antitoxin component of RelBE/YafQ-DinJ toxin-antitoxin module
MMDKKRITFYIESTVHGEFKKLCQKKGLVMSKKVQMLIEESIKKEA